MRSVVGGLLLALVMVAAAAVLWSEAAVARRIAGAHQRLATLNYDHDDGIDEGSSVLSRVPLPVALVTDELPEHRAKVAYWRAEYRDLTAAAPLSGGNTKKENIEPNVMLVAANAAFRSSLVDDHARDRSSAPKCRAGFPERRRDRRFRVRQPGPFGGVSATRVRARPPICEPRRISAPGSVGARRKCLNLSGPERTGSDRE